MAKLGRRPVLDEMKKGQILAIVAVGCSRRTAAAYVGCSTATIRREIERDKAFAEGIERHESSAQIGYVRNIQDAAKDAKYWRAAAWLLERRYPDDFGTKKQGAVTEAQLDSLLSELTEIIVDEVPFAEHRKGIIKRMQIMAGNFFDDLAKMREKAARDAAKRDAVKAAEGGAGAENENGGNTADTIGGDRTNE